MNLNPQSSAAILAHMASGKTQQQAIDAVLGASAFEKLASDLYDALCVKGGK